MGKELSASVRKQAFGARRYGMLFQKAIADTCEDSRKDMENKSQHASKINDNDMKDLENTSQHASKINDSESQHASKISKSGKMSFHASNDELLLAASRVLGKGKKQIISKLKEEKTVTKSSSKRRCPSPLQKRKHKKRKLSHSRDKPVINQDNLTTVSGSDSGPSPIPNQLELTGGVIVLDGRVMHSGEQYF